MTQLVRFIHPRDGARIGVRYGDEVRDVTALVGSVAAWLRSTVVKPSCLARTSILCARST